MNNSKEWIEAFNLHYNNSDKSAPDLNSYEISVFLTQAQDEIVKELYSGKNVYRESFDSDEHIRTALEYLIRDEELVPKELSKYRMFFQTKYLSTETAWYILLEEIIMNKLFPLTIPTKWDELNINLIDPFKKPNDRKVFRLKKGEYIYLISNTEIGSYKITYLVEPNPIIVENIGNENPLYQDMNLTIKGINKQTECKLGTNIHLNILNRAVELALRDYNPTNLQAHVQLNQRNF